MTDQTTDNTPILVVDDEESLRHTFKIFSKEKVMDPLFLLQILKRQFMNLRKTPSS